MSPISKQTIPTDGDGHRTRSGRLEIRLHAFAQASVIGGARVLIVVRASTDDSIRAQLLLPMQCNRARAGADPWSHSRTCKHSNLFAVPP